MEEGDDCLETKVILVGRTRVGKTCIVNAAITGALSVETKPTVGAGFSLKSFDLNGQRYVFQMWDTAGDERFRSMTPLYYRGASFALIVFAINDEESFSEIDIWRDSLLTSLTTPISILLVGNKADLEKERTVGQSTGVQKAEEINAHYVETSAKTGTGIDELFVYMAEQIRANPEKMLLVKKSVFREEETVEHCC
jgi:small GTP-binding protein